MSTQGVGPYRLAHFRAETLIFVGKWSQDINNTDNSGYMAFFQNSTSFTKPKSAFWLAIVRPKPTQTP